MVHYKVLRGIFMATATSVRVRNDIDLQVRSGSGSTVRLTTADDIREYARELACTAVGSIKSVERSSPTSVSSANNLTEPKKI